MTWYFCDRRSDFAHAWPEICVRPVACGVVDGQVEFDSTSPDHIDIVDDRKWFQNKLELSRLSDK